MSKRNKEPGDSLVNKHHNIPSSRGGSHEKINLSRTVKTHHDQFHRWAYNRMPCELTRIMAIHSIGEDGHTIDPECLDELFQTTTMQKSHRMYMKNAIIPATVPGALELVDRVARFKLTYLTEERLLLRRVLHALTTNGVLPSHDSEFRKRYIGFFGTHETRNAIHEMYVEEHQGELAWVKPMLKSTRDAVIATLGKPSLTYNRDMKRKLRPCIEAQEATIAHHACEWEVAIEKANAARRSSGIEQTNWSMQDDESDDAHLLAVPISSTVDELQSG